MVGPITRNLLWRWDKTTDNQWLQTCVVNYMIKLNSYFMVFWMFASQTYNVYRCKNFLNLIVCNLQENRGVYLLEYKICVLFYFSDVFISVGFIFKHLCVGLFCSSSVCFSYGKFLRIILLWRKSINNSWGYIYIYIILTCVWIQPKNVNSVY